MRHVIFILFSPNEQRGGALPDFLVVFFFPRSADHERDWPPCKVVLIFRVGNQYAECEKQQLLYKGRS